MQFLTLLIENGAVSELVLENNKARQPVALNLVSI